MTPLRVLAALVAVVALAVTSAPALAHPGHASHPGLPGATSIVTVPFPAMGASAGGFSSPNVEFVKNFPQHTDTAGARKVGSFFYITTERDLTIYDVSKPLDPRQVGYLLLPEPGMPVFTEEDPDTNGRILLVSNGGVLSVIDVTDKTAPKLLSELEGTDQHTITCVLDCTWAYGSEGAIVDLRDPAHPKLAPTGWQTDDIESFHDVTEVSPGIVLTSSQPLKLLDARTTPDRPTMLASTAKEEDRFVHANLWPRGGEDKFLLVGGEDVGPGCSESPSATFSTWDASTFRETGTTKQVGEFRLGPGVPSEGRAPESSFCVHWFDEHPYYADGGLVAISWYEHGTHFLDIGDDGQISEVGFFLGGGGQASAAYWIDERTVYVSDYLRGLDVLRFTGDIGSPPRKETGQGTTGGDRAQEQTPAQDTASPAQPAATKSNAAASPSCAAPAGFRATTARGRGAGRLALGFSRTSPAPVDVDVFQQSAGRRILGERLVARFRGRTTNVAWNGRANVAGRTVTDGLFFARYRTRTSDGVDTRRVALRRSGGRWSVRPSFYRRPSCDLLRSLKLERSVFGGRTNRALGISLQVERQARVTVTVRRGSKVVRRFAPRTAAARRTVRLRLQAEGLPRGDVRVRVEARRPGERVASTVVSRRL